MLCSNCNKNEATVFYKQILNNQVTQFHLCAECAKSSEALSPMGPPIFELLAGLGGLRLPAPIKALECSSCGLKYTEFRESGFLGCPSCYESFSEPLRDVLQHIHGSTQHKGKSPHAAAAKKRPPEDIARLRAELKTAIQSEKFEEAARLRDRLRQLEGS